MALKTVKASAINISGVAAVGKMVVVGAAILIGFPYVPSFIHLPVRATQTDVWDCIAKFSESF